MQAPLFPKNLLKKNHHAVYMYKYVMFGITSPK